MYAAHLHVSLSLINTFKRRKWDGLDEINNQCTHIVKQQAKNNIHAPIRKGCSTNFWLDSKTALFCILINSHEVRTISGRDSHNGMHAKVQEANSINELP